MQASQLPFSASPDWAGTDRYSVVRKVGEGGMGVVYEALDRDTHRTVALKTLLRFDPNSVYLFKQEFRALADVHHRNLVRLHELVQPETGPLFFTMELVEGTDFLDYVHGGGGVGPSRTLSPASSSATANSVTRQGPVPTRSTADGGPSAVSGRRADARRPRQAPPGAAPTRARPGRAARRRQAAPRHQALERPRDDRGPGRHPRLRDRHRALARGRRGRAVRRRGSWARRPTSRPSRRPAKCRPRRATGTRSASCSTRRWPGAAPSTVRAIEVLTRKLSGRCPAAPAPGRGESRPTWKSSASLS